MLHLKEAQSPKQHNYSILFQARWKTLSRCFVHLINEKNFMNSLKMFEFLGISSHLSIFAYPCSLQGAGAYLYQSLDERQGIHWTGRLSIAGKPRNTQPMQKLTSKDT